MIPIWDKSNISIQKCKSKYQLGTGRDGIERSESCGFASPEKVSSTSNVIKEYSGKSFEADVINLMSVPEYQLC